MSRKQQSRKQKTRKTSRKKSIKKESLPNISLPYSVILEVKQPDRSGPSRKYAIFDVDNTIIQPIRGRIVPLNRRDWKPRFSNTIQAIRDIYLKGYTIVFRTDQSKNFRIDLVRDVAEYIGIPILVLIAIAKDLKKPDTSLFLQEIKNMNANESFYVGDAAGRRGDWSAVDKEFANALGIRFYTPEEFFEKRLEEVPSVLVSNYTSSIPPLLDQIKEEVVIMIGIPGSGKSTIVQRDLKPKGYFILSGDDLGTSNPKKLIKIATDQWGKGQRKFVFDLTNLTEEHRANYRDWSHALGMTCRLVYVESDVKTAMSKVKERNKKDIPSFVIKMMNDKLQKPTSSEGCEELTVIDNRIQSDSYVSDNKERYKTFKPALLKKYKDFPTMDPIGWIAQIKYDGVRGIFIDGKLITRKNNIIHAPRIFMRWFEGLPSDLILDGELYIPGEPLNKISGLMNRDDPTDEDWKRVKFMLFDIVVDEPYERRIPILMRVANSICGRLENSEDCPLEVVKTTVIQSRGHLQKMLEEAVKTGEEGIVIRNPRSLYPYERSSDILKVKPVYDDDEAVVIGYEKGTGKNANRLGALKVHWKDRPEITFKVGQGIGLTDYIRDHYLSEFPLGSIITVQFNGTYESGRPREPKIIGRRFDV
jgi:DNA 3'-phosphatase